MALAAQRIQDQAVLAMPVPVVRSLVVPVVRNNSGPGGDRYNGPGGPAYDGPGGPAYSGPGGPCYAGPGGACYSGPGGTGEDCPRFADKCGRRRLGIAARCASAKTITGHFFPLSSSCAVHEINMVYALAALTICAVFSSTPVSDV
jgi:hypothetical protein